MIARSRSIGRSVMSVGPQATATRRHCEKRSDKAIPASRVSGAGLLRFARNDKTPRSACGELLLEEDALVARRVVEPGEFLVAEPRIEFRSLERERIDPGRVAAELSAVALGRGDQAAADAGAAQFGMHPQQI